MKSHKTYKYNSSQADLETMNLGLSNRDGRQMLAAIDNLETGFISNETVQDDSYLSDDKPIGMIYTLFEVNQTAHLFQKRVNSSGTKYFLVPGELAKFIDDHRRLQKKVEKLEAEMKTLKTSEK